MNSQIKEQEIQGLTMIRRDIEAIMRFRHGVGLASLLDDRDFRIESATKRNHVFESRLKRTLANISKVIFFFLSKTKYSNFDFLLFARFKTYSLIIARNFIDLGCLNLSVA